MRTKESRLRSLAAAVAVLLPLLAIASAAEDVLAITECAAEERDACAATANRTCYLYPNGTHACGNCLNAYFEFEGTCHDIEEVDAEGGFDFLSRLLELYLPEYVDPNVTTDERAEKLKQATKTVSFWMSAIPPPSFELGLTRETFLTDEERRGRLGIRSDLRYDEDSYLSAPGNRGRMERFVVPGSANEGSGEAGDSTRARRMQDVPPPKPAVDWDEEGYVTEVKNQGLCGCCWAVATAAAVESALMITNQTSRYDNLDENSLSFQQMISCDEAESACQGGNIFQAIRYVWEHNDVGNGNFGGLFSYDDWPYTDRMGRATMDCKAQSVKDSGKEPVAYLNFPQMVNSVNDRFTSFEERKNRLMTAVSIQPVISVMKSGCDLFANYDGGVLTHDDDCQCCDVSCIDHAIVIVGYDSTASPPYWKLRNSWGPEWGEDGHFRIAMNDEGCGWGLYGMLAEAAMPSQAYKTLDELPERPGWWARSATWEKVLVILFSVLGFCCLCGCLATAWNKRK